MVALSDELCQWVNTSALAGTVKWSMCVYPAHSSRDIHVSGDIVKWGAWEPNFVNGMLRALQVHADQKPALLDLGANIGAFTLAAASAGFRVYAFEPVPRNADMLMSSIRRNGLEHLVTLYPFAVSAEVGTFKMGVSNMNQGGVHHEPSRESRGVQLAAVPLDRVMRPAELPVFYLKMDLEDGECRAVRGMQRLVATTDIIGVNMETHARTKECCVVDGWTESGGFWHLLSTRHKLVPNTPVGGKLRGMLAGGCYETRYDVVWTRTRAE